MFFVVASERFADHLTPPGHPDRVARAHVMDAVAAEAAAQGVTVSSPQPAPLEALLRVHAPAYVEQVTGSHEPARLDPETFTSADSAEVARLAAGAVVLAVERATEQGRGQSGTAVALVMARPPGHHAERDRAMGFCIYNNVAIDAR